MKRLVLATALAATVVPLTACGTETDHAGDPAHIDRVHPADIAYSDGATDVLFQVVTAGGYTPMEYQQAIRPSITVYGDGTVIVEPDGAQNGGFDRMIGLQQGHLDELTRQKVLHLADDAGLLAPPPNYDMADGMMVTDQATTTVTLSSDAGTFVHAAYALGAGSDTDTPARTNLADFITAATEAATHAVRLSDYAPTQVGLYVTPDGRAGNRAVEWPATTGIDLSAKGAQSCHDVSPDQAAALYDLLSTTDIGTDVRQGKRAYSVVAVQVLPGEKCPVGR